MCFSSRSLTFFSFTSVGAMVIITGEAAAAAAAAAAEVDVEPAALQVVVSPTFPLLI